MGEDSKISWTHHTFNPWWGCEKVSPACAHCYAETWAARCGFAKDSPSGKPPLWGAKSERRFYGDKHWNAPLKWERQAAAGERHRVFCASMADVFEDREDLIPHRARLFDLIRRTPNLDWLLLTKRPENINPSRLVTAVLDTPDYDGRVATAEWLQEWQFGTPPANVWLGTTVENQEMADKRIPELLKIPAKVRFLSCEPLLGPVDLTRDRVFPGKLFGECGSSKGSCSDNSCRSKIDWVICGGESGPHARPMHPNWARSLRDQCEAANVPFHFKQWGEWVPLSEKFDTSTLIGHSTEDSHYKQWAKDGYEASASVRIGTARAGRLLDGTLHDAFPIL